MLLALLSTEHCICPGNGLLSPLLKRDLTSTVRLHQDKRTCQRQQTIDRQYEWIPGAITLDFGHKIS
jgi:hypothetical protein